MSSKQCCEGLKLCQVRWSGFRRRSCSWINLIGWADRIPCLGQSDIWQETDKSSGVDASVAFNTVCLAATFAQLVRSKKVAVLARS